MEWAAFILSIVALGLSLWAVRRTGGVAEMKKQVESLSSLGESLRKKTADLLDVVEKKVRGEKPTAEKEEQAPPRDEGRG